MVRLKDGGSAGRWFALLGAMWLLTCAGNSYNFAIYSSTIKDVLGYNQQSLAALGVAKDIGDNVGLLAGFMSDFVPPAVVLATGATFNFVGYGGLWLVLSRRIASPAFWQVAVLLCLACNGSIFFVTAGLVNSQLNFPSAGGTVAGIVVGFIGLSGAVFSQLFSALLAPDTPAFLLLLALAPSAAGLACTLLLRQHPPPKPSAAAHAEEGAKLRLIFRLCLLLAAFLLASLLGQALLHVPRWAALLLTMGMLALLAAPALVLLPSRADPPAAPTLSAPLLDPSRSPSHASSPHPPLDTLSAIREEADEEGGAAPLPSPRGHVTFGLHGADAAGFESLFPSTPPPSLSLFGSSAPVRAAAPGRLGGAPLSASVGGAAGAIASSLSRSAGIPGVLLAPHPHVVHAGSLVGAPGSLLRQRRGAGDRAAPVAVAGHGSASLRAHRALQHSLASDAGSVGPSGVSLVSEGRGLSQAAEEGDSREDGRRAWRGGELEEPEEDEERGEEGGADEGEGRYFFGEEDPSVRPSRERMAALEQVEEGYRRKWLPEAAGAVGEEKWGGEEEEEEEGEEEDEEEEEEESSEEQGAVSKGPLGLSQHAATGEACTPASSARPSPALGEDHSVAQALISLDFWLLFVGLVTGFGAGLTAVANLAQIAEAQAFPHVHALTSLLSVAQFLGRLAGGAVSEQLVRSAALPRPAALAAVQLLMLPGHLAFAMAFPGAVAVGVALVGACFGALCSVMPTAAGELFGLRSLGMLYNCLLGAAPIGSYLCSGLLAGLLYEREAERDGPHSRHPVGLLGSMAAGDGQQTCHGAHCFRLTFLLLMVVCVAGAGLHLVVAARTRQLYREVKERHDAGMAAHAVD